MEKLKFLESKRNIILLLIIFLLLLTFSGVLKSVIDFLFLDNIYQRNIEFLNDSNTKTRNSFLIISTFKMITSIVEGSTIDITVLGLEAGDFVQPFYNLLNITWKFLLAALVSINIQKILLQTAEVIKSYFNIYVYLALFSLLLEYYLRKINLKNNLLKFIFSLYALGYKILIFSIIIITVFLPLFIYSSEYISSTFIDSHIDQASSEINSKLEEIAAETDLIKDEVIGISAVSLFSGNSTGNIKDSLIKIFQSSPELFNDTMNHLFLLMASFILKIFIVPLLILIIEYYFIKHSLKYFLELMKKYNLDKEFTINSSKLTGEI